MESHPPLCLSSPNPDIPCRPLQPGLFSKQGNNSKVPPGPKTLPIVGSIFYLRRSFLDLGPTLRRLADTYGPVITLYIGSQPSVHITDCDVAHRALVDHAAAFAGRPPPLGANHVFSSGGRNISSAAYGPLWRHLRRNLTAGVLHPSHVKSFARARELAVNSLVKNIKSEAIENGVVTNVGYKIQHAMFDLLVTMCFGEEVSEEMAKTVEGVQRELVGMDRRKASLAEEVEEVLGYPPQARRDHDSNNKSSSGKKS
ncbi:cytochrome P450 89A9-like [Typha angustifolia]|uniref:cytochrome P450 89A9-like n=1 Tax=Typha angustifolia TaxID=59011 RepID=UPI003C30C7AA